MRTSGPFVRGGLMGIALWIVAITALVSVGIFARVPHAVMQPFALVVTPMTYIAAQVDAVRIAKMDDEMRSICESDPEQCEDYRLVGLGVLGNLVVWFLAGGIIASVAHRRRRR